MGVVIKFPMQSVARTVEDRAILSGFYDTARDMFPHRTAKEHWDAAILGFDVTGSMASARVRLAMQGQADGKLSTSP